MRYNKLKGRMVEKRISQKKLAKTLGISLSTLNEKINDKREFTVSEVVMLCEVLDIIEPKDYFFTQNVPNTQQMVKKDENRM